MGWVLYVRIHYTYTNTDGPANIEPDFASTNYFIRSSKRSRTEDASNRVDDCAKGAALMTGTRVEIELVTSNQEMKVNRPLAEAFYQAMTETSLPEYTKEELERILTETGRLEILKIWTTEDEDREEGAKLLNVLAKKIS